MGNVVGVAAAQIGDDDLGPLARGESALGLATKLRPAVASRPRTTRGRPCPIPAPMGPDRRPPICGRHPV